MNNTSRFKVVIFVFMFACVAIASGCKDNAPLFQVNDVVSDPGAYSGALTVEGVVSAFSEQDASIVGIMDKKELQCTTPNCKKVLLAVKVVDAKLAVGDEVKVSGSIVKESWGYLLKADQVQVVGRHNLGRAS